jgi:hypothetical protein
MHRLSMIDTIPSHQMKAVHNRMEKDEPEFWHILLDSIRM